MNLFILLFILSTSVSSQELRRIDLNKRTFHRDESQNSRILQELNPISCPLVKSLMVQADFGQAYFTNSNHPSNNTFLAVVISSNETGISTSSYAKDVNTFVCDSSYCIEDDSTLHFVSSWTSTTAKRMHLNTTISIAGGAWQLRTSALSVSFSSVGKFLTGSHYGWIGLGTESKGKLNFKDENPMFSLLINKTRDGMGSLVFGFDSRIADIDRPLMVVNSDTNWKMQMTSLSFGSVVYFEENKTFPIIFELWAEGIILPERIRDSLIYQMGQYNLKCYGSGCETYNISGLPSIVFELADGKNFSLRPEDYMRVGEVDPDLYVSLWIKKENHLYIKDHIVLGWDVLANFYTFFQQTDGVNTISFYEINSATTHNLLEKNSSDFSLVRFIIIGVSIVILVGVGALIFNVRKNKPKVSIETTELSKFEASHMPVDSQEQSHFL